MTCERTEKIESHEQPCLLPGGLLWYHALIDRVAASEKKAIIQKMEEYGFTSEIAEKNVFAMLDAVGRPYDDSMWAVWQIGAERHWGAIQRLLKNSEYIPHKDVCKLLIKRALDLLGYTYQAIAMCDYLIHEEEPKPGIINWE